MSRAAITSSTERLRSTKSMTVIERSVSMDAVMKNDALMMETIVVCYHDAMQPWVRGVVDSAFVVQEKMNTVFFRFPTDEEMSSLPDSFFEGQTSRLPVEAEIFMMAILSQMRN